MANSKRFTFPVCKELNIISLQSEKCFHPVANAFTIECVRLVTS
uniref:Uncharacterized protein n=1 Tax=Anguilla anguilla TaxID=7936 RepID=A0A0E9U5V3_ANGAN